MKEGIFYLIFQICAKAQKFKNFVMIFKQSMKLKGKLQEIEQLSQNFSIA